MYEVMLSSNMKVLRDILFETMHKSYSYAKKEMQTNLVCAKSSF